MPSFAPDTIAAPAKPIVQDAPPEIAVQIPSMLAGGMGLALGDEGSENEDEDLFGEKKKDSEANW